MKLFAFGSPRRSHFRLSLGRSMLLVGALAVACSVLAHIHRRNEHFRQQDLFFREFLALENGLRAGDSDDLRWNGSSFVDNAGKLVDAKYISDISFINFPCDSDQERFLIESFPNAVRIHILEKPTPSLLRAISQLKNVRYVGTDGFEDELAAQLPTMPQLRELDLSFCRISARSLPALGRQTGLETLELLNTDIDADSLQPLASLVHLKSLGLHGTSLGKADLTPIATLPALRELYLSSTELRPDQLPALACSRVQDLYLGSNPLQGSSLAVLARLPGLTELDLSDCHLSAQDTLPLFTAPRLRLLSLTSNDMTDEVVPPDSLQHSGLQTLYLGGNTLHSSFVAMLSRLPALTELSLISCDLAPADVSRLFSMPSLRIVNLTDNAIFDDIVPPLGPEHCSLEKLTLDDIPLHSSLIATISQFPALRELHLRSCRLSTSDVACLFSMPSLRVLDLTENPVDDDIVPSLGPACRLEYLKIGDTKISPEAAETIRQKLKTLKNLQTYADLRPNIM